VKEGDQDELGSDSLLWEIHTFLIWEGWARTRNETVYSKLLMTRKTHTHTQYVNNCLH